MPVSNLKTSNKAKGGISKQKQQESKACKNCPKNKHFLPANMHMYVCVSEYKKCSFFGIFGVLCFLVTYVLRFACLPYYRRWKK